MPFQDGLRSPRRLVIRHRPRMPVPQRVNQATTPQMSEQVRLQVQAEDAN